MSQFKALFYRYQCSFKTGNGEQWEQAIVLGCKWLFPWFWSKRTPPLYENWRQQHFPFGKGMQTSICGAWTMKIIMISKFERTEKMKGTCEKSIVHASSDKGAAEKSTWACVHVLANEHDAVNDKKSEKEHYICYLQEAKLPTYPANDSSVRPLIKKLKARIFWPVLTNKKNLIMIVIIGISAFGIRSTVDHAICRCWELESC